jgi:hypothetical protein
MNLENLAGGLFSSLKPHTKIAEGTATAAYQIHLDAMTFVAPPPDETTPSFFCCCKTCAARSLRVARKTALSSFETCLRTTCCEKQREGADNRLDAADCRPEALDATFNSINRLEDICKFYLSCNACQLWFLSASR